VLALPTQLLGILSALTSAASWGGGDYAGGVATRRNHAFFVLLITSSTGLILLTALTLLFGEHLPNRSDVFWAISAGIFGGIGLITLFRGLAVGAAAIVSPVAGVVGAAVPVIAGAVLEGFPAPEKFAGFLLGFAGIWMVTRPSNDSAAEAAQPEREAEGLLSQPLALAFIAGIGFGLFFVLIAQVSEGAAFAPLALSKATQAVGGLLLVLLLRIRLADRGGVVPAVVSGVLDVGGNVFFLFASKLARLDVAAVLSSMYPVGTVLLSRALLKEQISRSQWLGVALCMGAIALIAV